MVKSAATTVLLLICAVSFGGCTKNLLHAPIERYEQSGKSLILLQVYSKHKIEFVHSKKVETVLEGNYHYERIRLSGGYHEADLQDHVARMKLAGEYRWNLTFKEFLRIRNGPPPLSDDEIRLIDDIGLSQTPELVVLDHSGRVLDHFPMGWGDIYQRNRDKSRELRDTEEPRTYWDPKAESSQEQIFEFLNRNAK